MAASTQYAKYTGLGGGSSAVTTYATFASFPATAANGAVAIALDTDDLYAFNTGSNSWVLIGGPSTVLSIGTLDSQTASVNGAVIASDALVLQSASTTRPGLVNNTTQSFSGNKTFTGTIGASNLSGTNTGDVTLGTANGLSLTLQALSLGLSSTSTTGSLSSTDWNTFNSKQAAGNYITALTGDVSATGPGSVAATISNLARSKLASGTANYVVINNGSGVMSEESLLAMSRGGTNASLTAANGAIPYSTASALALLAPGTSGQLLVSGGAGAPTWGLYQNIAGTSNMWLSPSATGSGAITSANNNISIGASAGIAMTSGNKNVFIGANSGIFVTSANSITSIGYNAGSNVIGNNNTFLGATAGNGASSGIQNTFIGSVAGPQSASAASNNTGLGYGALNAITSGAQNTGIGPQTFNAYTTQSNGVAVGYQAGFISTGAQCTFLGSLADASSAAYTNSTAIGYNAKVGANNVVVLGSGGVNLGIDSVTAPTARMHVPAGTATAGTAPIKIPAGTNLTAVEDGALEYDGTNLSFTIGSTRSAIRQGTVGVANGGTGLTSGTSGGILGFTGSTTLASSGALTASQLIIGGGAGATPSTLAAGSQYQVLTMGASNPGYGAVNLAQAAAITGALPIGNGGTGQATKAAGFDALSPMSASGDIIYGGTAGTGTRLAKGADGQVLTLASGLPSWSSAGTGTVTSVTFTGDGTVLSSTPSSAVTTSGTVTASLKTQTANTFFAGPTSGGAANPTFRALATADLTAPTVQKFTSSSGTYTTPTSPRSPLYIRVRMVGAGGGGAGGGSAAGTAAGTGGNTTFGSSLLVANGGVGGTFQGTGGDGGTASLGTGPIGTALTGGMGGSGGQTVTITTVALQGGSGGSTFFGGAGSGTDGPAGSAGKTNTGGGGGGAGSNGVANGGSGSGGGAGGFVDALISAPSATYSYAVGAAGTAGGAGTGGNAGGAGGSGYIEVTEYYQ